MKTLLYASAILASLIAGALAAPQGAAPAAPRGSPFVIPPAAQPVVPPSQPVISPAVPLDVVPPVGTTPSTPTDIISPAVPIDPAVTPVTTPQQAVTGANAGNVAMTPQTTAQATPQTIPQTTAQMGNTPVGTTLRPLPTPQNLAQADSVTPNSVTPAFLNLSGTPLTDSRGHPVGSVQQVVLNQAGNINIAVVNTGGRLVPIPWRLVGACNVPGRPGLMVNMDPATLSQAPSMTMNQMPLLTHEATLDQIFRFFGLAPGSAMTASTSTAQGSATANGATITGSATSSP